MYMYMLCECGWWVYSFVLTAGSVHVAMLCLFLSNRSTLFVGGYTYDTEQLALFSEERK